MVARQELRRRNFFDGAFRQPEVGVAGVAVRSMAIDRPSGMAPLVELFDGDDQILVVPGRLVAPPDRADVFDSPAVRDVLGRRKLRAERTADDGEGGVVHLSMVSADDGVRLDPVVAAQATLEILALEEAVAVSPLYGFLANQTMQPCDDPEEALVAVAAPVGDRGAGVRITIVDNGIHQPSWWPGLAVPGGEPDPLDALIPAPAEAPGAYLGRAAGHGSFMAGIVAQLAPRATITVRRVGDTEGFVDELRLSTALHELAAEADPPDVIVLACGAYGIKVGSMGTAAAGDGTGWRQPHLLRHAIDTVSRRLDGTVIVCAAGNYGSKDPCYPAAFSTEHRGRVVAVAALDQDGRRASFSNYGDWVDASTLGVRLRSRFVPGTEHPGNDPDGRPEEFNGGGSAEWSGTSFAAPVVAGQLAALLGAIRAQAPFTARQAWSVLGGLSGPAVDPGCGKAIEAGPVAHA
jgi:subtilisin family serine protease